MAKSKINVLELTDYELTVLHKISTAANTDKSIPVSDYGFTWAEVQACGRISRKALNAALKDASVTAKK